MLNSAIHLRTGLLIILIYFLSYGSIMANPRFGLQLPISIDYELLANFQVDSLEQMARIQLKTTSSSDRILAFHQLAALQIAQNRFDEAYQTFLRLYQQGINTPNLSQELYLQGALSETALLAGDLSLALEWRQQFLERAQYLGRCEQEAWAHKRLGRLFLKDQQFSQAKKQFEEAIKDYQKMGNAAMVLALRQEWGVINLRKRNYLSAINCFVSNMEEQNRNKDTLGMMSSLKHLVEIYDKVDDPEAMEKYCQEIIRWATGAQWQIWQSGAYLKLGRIEEARNNIGLAKEYYLQNQHLLLTTTAQPHLLHTLKAKRPVYQMIGDFRLPIASRQLMKENRIFSLLLFWIRLGDFQQAQAVLDRWLSPKKGNKPTIRTARLAYRLQTESYRNQARFPAAVEAFGQLLKNPTLAPSYDPTLNKFMDFQEEAKESHEKLLLLFENQEQQRIIAQGIWRNRSLLAGILLALLLSGFLFYTNRQKKHNNLILSNKNQLIAEALAEKEMLIREVHHRVKNNLQVVSSLLNLQARRVEDPQVVGAIQEGRDRVKSMAFIHQKLYQLDDVRQMGVPDYVDNLTQYLFASYQVDPEQIQLSTHIDNLELDVDIMVPLGLMLNEMISNALKHAFPKGKPGQLSVTFVEKANSYLLEVKDTGVGTPEQALAGQGGGFGYQLIQTFCKKLKGEIEVSNQAGTSIQFRFPKAVAQAA